MNQTIDQILLELLRAHGVEYDAKTTTDIPLMEAEQAIVALIGQIIGAKQITLTDIYGSDWRNHYGYTETQVRDAANHLQRKQFVRLQQVIKGGDQ